MVLAWIAWPGFDAESVFPSVQGANEVTTTTVFAQCTWSDFQKHLLSVLFSSSISHCQEFHLRNLFWWISPQKIPFQFSTVSLALLQIKPMAENRTDCSELRLKQLVFSDGHRSRLSKWILDVILCFIFRTSELLILVVKCVIAPRWKAKLQHMHIRLIQASRSLVSKGTRNRYATGGAIGPSHCGIDRVRWSIRVVVNPFRALSTERYFIFPSVLHLALRCC